MFLIKTEGLQRGSRIIRETAVFLSACLLASRCGLFKPEALRVDPGVLDDVRSIGKVLAEATTEGVAWERGTEITNRFVIDVGGVNASEALKKASDLLRKREREVVTEKIPEFVQMDSVAREDAHLTINAFNPLNVGLSRRDKESDRKGARKAGSATPIVDSYQS